MELLAHLTCFVPDALAGLHGRMLDADVLSSFFYPHVLQHGIMFRSADPEARDRLSMLAVQSPSRALGDHALKSLAWVDDVEVPRLCSRFDEHPPPWASPRFSAAEYALWAGWLLDSGDGRPLLLSAGCRRLERGAETGCPVVVISRTQQECGRCSGPLTALLELDLHDERLGFLGLPGGCLRVLTCEDCVQSSTVYAEVDLAGGARWMEESPQPHVVPSGMSYLPERQLGRPERRTPFEAHAFANHMSQVGGQAGWIQNPDYPQCPWCRRLMPFLGQVHLMSEFESDEGTIYAFFDPGCGVVATLFQQT